MRGVASERCKKKYIPRPEKISLLTFMGTRPAAAVAGRRNNITIACIRYTHTYVVYNALLYTGIRAEEGKTVQAPYRAEGVSAFSYFFFLLTLHSRVHGYDE